MKTNEIVDRLDLIKSELKSFLDTMTLDRLSFDETLSIVAVSNLINNLYDDIIK